MTTRNLPDVQRAAVALMRRLVLENGKRWGECAAGFQREDATAVFSPTGPNKHFLTRPRGGSKTTDIAAMAIGWLVAEAPPRSHGYVVASNSVQAAEVIDAAAGLIIRTPELADYLTFESERIVAPTQASVSVVAMSESGAWGKRDAHLLVCDEFAQWPATRGAQRVWTAIRSTVPKTPGCRLVILTSAGEPSHWSYKILQAAYTDTKDWRVHEVPGPVPWQDPTELASLERELLPSEYERLVLNIWSEAEDRAITPEDYEAARQPAYHHGTAPAGVKGGGARLRFPHPGSRYILTVDVGTRFDATVVCVAHAEPMTEDDPRGPKRVVVDHLERWQGSKRHHVDIDKVRDRVADLAIEYNRARVYGDPDQFVGSLQGLNRRGVKAEEWRFTATSVGLIATALAQTFRNHCIWVPHSDALRTELLRVKLRESAPGVTRLDHDRAGHDDQAVAIGMACHILLARQGFGSAKAFIEATGEAAELAEAKRTQREAHRDDDHLAGFVRRVSQRGAQFRAAEDRRTRRCQHRFRAEPPHRCVHCGMTEEETAPALA